MKRLVAITAIIAALLIASSPAADAHPLGNFTVNTYAGLRVQPERVLVRYVVDMAEIPTFQERERIDIDHNSKIDEPERTAYATATCARLGRGLDIRVDDKPIAPTVTGRALTFPPGAAGLPTMRLVCDLAAAGATQRAERNVRFLDSNFTGRVGWREVTAGGDRTTLIASDVPATSISGELTRYPEDLLRSPPQVREASVRVRPGGPAAAASGTIAVPSALPRGVDAATRAFTAFLSHRSFTVPFAILALLIAVVLGAVHALAPGHGKTVMAAYLVGKRGSLRQAALIGLTVTATHTAGVLALGIVLSASASVATERIYPALGAASGVMLCAIGATLLARAIKSNRAVAHAHAHPHPHPHPEAPAIGTRGLLGIGFAGGLVPSPSAVVVLLGAIALGRAWFGVMLVLAYGAGMAGTLCGAGLLLVKTRSFFERDRASKPSGRFLRTTGHAIPVVTAAVILGVGLTLAVRGISQI